MPDNDLTMRDLCAHFDVTRWTIHRWMRKLEFPKPKRLAGTKANHWDADSVDHWATMRRALAEKQQELNGDRMAR